MTWDGAVNRQRWGLDGHLKGAGEFFCRVWRRYLRFRLGAPDLGTRKSAAVGLDLFRLSLNGLLDSAAAFWVGLVPCVVVTLPVWVSADYLFLCLVFFQAIVGETSCPAGVCMHSVV